MKAFLQTSTSKTSLPFEIEMIEQCVEENLYDVTKINCSNNAYKIIWLKKGNASFSDHHVDMSLKPGYIFCLHIAQQSVINLSNDAEGYIISFTENFLKVDELEFDLGCQAILLQMLLSAKGISVHDELTTELNEIVSRLIKEYMNSFIFKTEILRRYLKIFLIYLSRQFNESFQLVPQTRNNELVQQFLQSVEKNFRDKKMVADYAEMLFVTPNYLNEITKKITGSSAGHHIRQRIALEAKRMALSSENSMKQIAYDLGFIDCAHFSKFFKTITGSNFTDFKKDKLTVAIAVS